MNEKDDNKQFQQDPVQREINERLKYARYKVPNQKKCDINMKICKHC